MIATLIALALSAAYPTNMCTPDTATTHDFTVYVSPTTGSDLYSCTNAARPCKTFKAALCRIPHHVEDAIVVYAYPGTYRESLVADFDTVGNGAIRVLPAAGAWPTASVYPAHGYATVGMGLPDGGWGDWNVNSFKAKATTCGANDGGPAVCDGGQLGDAGIYNVWGPNVLVGNFIQLPMVPAMPLAANSTASFKSMAFGTGSSDWFDIVTPPIVITGDGIGDPLLTVVGAQSGMGISFSGVLFDNTTNMASWVVEAPAGALAISQSVITGVMPYGAAVAIFNNSAPLEFTKNAVIVPANGTGVFSDVVGETVIIDSSAIVCTSGTNTTGISLYQGGLTSVANTSVTGCAIGVYSTLNAGTLAITNSNLSSEGTGLHVSSAQNTVASVACTAGAGQNSFTSNTLDISYGAVNPVGYQPPPPCGNLGMDAGQTCDGGALVYDGGHATYSGACSGSANVVDPSTNNRLTH